MNACGGVVSTGLNMGLVRSLGDRSWTEVRHVRNRAISLHA